MANRFVAIANSGSDSDGEIRRGHERVLRARFNDARFFWQFDQRSSLSDRLEDLKAVTFQASLGSYWSKTESNLDAVARLSEALPLDAADATSALACRASGKDRPDDRDGGRVPGTPRQDRRSLCGRAGGVARGG